MADPAPRSLVAVETIAPPSHYSPQQIREAFDVAYGIGRGKLILATKPRGASAAG